MSESFGIDSPLPGGKAMQKSYSADLRKRVIKAVPGAPKPGVGSASPLQRTHDTDTGLVNLKNRDATFPALLAALRRTANSHEPQPLCGGSSSLG